MYLDHDEQFSNLSCDGTESYFLDAYLGGMNVWEKGYNAYKPSTSWDSKQDEGVKVTTTAKDGIFKLSGSAEDLRFLSRKFILGFGGYVYRIRHNVDFAKVDILDIDSKYKNSNPNGTKNWIADVTKNEQAGLALPIHPAYLNTRTRRKSFGAVQVYGGSDEYLIENLSHFTDGGVSRKFILYLDYLVENQITLVNVIVRVTYSLVWNNFIANVELNWFN